MLQSFRLSFFSFPFTCGGSGQEDRATAFIFSFSPEFFPLFPSFSPPMDQL